MAILKVLAVKDCAAQSFSTPIFVPSVSLALRSFQTEVNRVDPSNFMNSYPRDFELYELGEFDDGAGSFLPFPSPRLVSRALDVVLVPQGER